MDAMVTARVPVEIKEQGNAILKEIGSSPTKLVNAAYEYVLATHELPSPRTTVEYLHSSDDDAHRERYTVLKLTQIERDRAIAAAEACRLPEPSGGWDHSSFEELLAEARKDRYASFA